MGGDPTAVYTHGMFSAAHGRQALIRRSRLSLHGSVLQQRLQGRVAAVLVRQARRKLADLVDDRIGQGQRLVHPASLGLLVALSSL